MLRWSLLASLLALLVASPVHASVAERYLPIYDASDDVHVRAGGDSLRFGPKAAKLYKTIAGKRAYVGCAEVSSDDGRFDRDGFMAHPSYRIPKRRGVVLMWTSGDYCAIATKRGKADGPCLSVSDEKDVCVRVIVATSDKGRAFLDQRSRSIELSVAMTVVPIAADPNARIPGATRLERVQAFLGLDVVELATPEDSPPAGKVGYWLEGVNLTAVVLLADGTRRFARFQDGVFSTNDLDLAGLDRDEIFELV